MYAARDPRVFINKSALTYGAVRLKFNSNVQQGRGSWIPVRGKDEMNIMYLITCDVWI